MVGDDDPGTAAGRRGRDRRRPDRFRVVIDDQPAEEQAEGAQHRPPALPRATSSGVFDAEDEVAPDLLRHVDRRLPARPGRRRPGRRAAHELPLHLVLGAQRASSTTSGSAAGCTSTPRRGSSPSAATPCSCAPTWLRPAGGWDADCLAEDCDLGVRLSSAGAPRSRSPTSPELVTREETPATARRPACKQRTRWNQGFLQVLRKGEWRTLRPAGSGCWPATRCRSRSCRP